MLIYLVIINIISFLIYGLDKFFSIKKMFRISEFILLSFGLIGGVIGSFLGIKIFHHKTRKIKFKIYLTIYFVLWIIIIYKFY